MRLVTLRQATTLRRIITRLRGQFPMLASIADRLEECTALQNEIGRVLDEDGEIMDSASVKLANVRREHDHRLGLSSPRSWRADSLTELHVPFKALGFLEFDTFAGGRQSWYENSNVDDDSFLRSAGVAGAGVVLVLATPDLPGQFIVDESFAHTCYVSHLENRGRTEA